MYRTNLIIFLFSLFMLTASSCAPSMNGSPGSPEWWELDEEDRYWVIKNEFSSYVATQGYRLEREVQNMLDQLIMNRVSDAVMRKKPENMENTRSQIRENTKKLVNRMIAEAQADRDYSLKHPGVIGEMAYTRAFAICPLWPFCD